jgi:hypothetical protein
MVPPGRFLKQDPKTKLWNDVGEKKALDKTRQALREGAPEMLKDMGGGSVGSDESGDSVDCAVSSIDAFPPLNVPWEETVNNAPIHHGHWNSSFVAAELQRRALQQQMQPMNEESLFTPDFNAQLQLLKLQLQVNTQSTNPDTANQVHWGGVRDGLERNGNSMGNSQNLYSILAAAQAQNIVGGGSTLPTNQLFSSIDNFQIRSLGAARRIYNNNDNVPRAAAEAAHQFQQQQRIREFALLNATGNGSNAISSCDPNRTFMRDMDNFHDHQQEQEQQQQWQQQQQQQPQHQQKILTSMPTMIETDVARRPGTMRTSGPNSDSFTRAQRIGLKNENFKNRRPGLEQSQSLSSSSNSLKSSIMSVGSLKSSIMSVEGLSLDDMDGTALFDVFDNS